MAAFLAFIISRLLLDKEAKSYRHDEGNRPNDDEKDHGHNGEVH